MKKIVVLSLVLAVGVQIGRMLESGSKVAAAGAGQGGGVEKCAATNGDVNADGNVDLSDAVTILGSLFLGSPAELVGLCTPPELEACQADLATSQAALASSQEKLALCQAAKGSALPDTGQNACSKLVNSNVGKWEEVPCAEADCQGQDAQYSTGCPLLGRFVDNGDGTVTDNCTGLQWQQNTADVNGDGETPPGFSDALPWCGALAYCENLGLAGHDDWRLPNVRELQSIVDYGRSNPAIDPVFGALIAGYWTSTSYAYDPAFACYVHFSLGHVVNGIDKGSYFDVRAVRNAP